MNSNDRGNRLPDGSFQFKNQIGTADMPRFVKEFNYRKFHDKLKHRFFYGRKADTGSHIQSFGVKLAAAIRHSN